VILTEVKGRGFTNNPNQGPPKEDSAVGPNPRKKKETCACSQKGPTGTELAPLKQTDRKQEGKKKTKEGPPSPKGAWVRASPERRIPVNKKTQLRPTLAQGDAPKTCLSVSIGEK